MPSIEFQIPPKIKKEAPKLQTFDLGVNASFIKQIILKIPEGHKGLAFIKVWSGGLQLIPQLGSSIEYVFGDKQDLSFNINQRIDGVPYKIYCQGYNLDNALPHSFYLDIYTQ
jgi:hypothetical protein